MRPFRAVLLFLRGETLLHFTAAVSLAAASTTILGATLLGLMEVIIPVPVAVTHIRWNIGNRCSWKTNTQQSNSWGRRVHDRSCDDWRYHLTWSVLCEFHKWFIMKIYELTPDRWKQGRTQNTYKNGQEVWTHNWGGNEQLTVTTSLSDFLCSNLFNNIPVIMKELCVQNVIICQRSFVFTRLMSVFLN